MAKTAGQKISQQKYNDEHFDRLAILIKKGKREEYKQAAAIRGLGYAEMIRLAIEEYIQNHAPEIPNEETIRAIEEAEKDVDMIGPFDTVEEAMEALNAPD